jgi:hypothetical protein
MFLQRHSPLLRALAEWLHLEGAEKAHETACWNEFASALGTPLGN